MSDETKYELWYSVENGGDGSAYPIFFNSKDNAEQHQENLDEGWAEDCSGAVRLVIRDNDIYLVERRWLSELSRHEDKYLKLPTAPETTEILKSRFDSLVEMENEYNILLRESQNKDNNNE